MLDTDQQIMFLLLNVRPSYVVAAPVLTYFLQIRSLPNNCYSVFNFSFYTLNAAKAYCRMQKY